MNIIQRLALLDQRFDPRRVPNLLAGWRFRDPRNGGVGLADGDGITICEDWVDPRRAFFDPFTRADSALTLGTQWTASAGTFGIASNLGYVAVSSGATDRAVRDCGLANGVIGATFTTVATTQRLVFRSVDVDNEIYVNAAATQWELTKVVAGTPSTIGTYVAVPANGDTVRVVPNGSSLTVYINGTSRITATDTFNQTATICGIESVNTTVPRWDDFIVAKLTDALQTTAAAKPLYKLAIQNGKAVGRFDGAAQYMETGPIAAFETSTLTWLAVFKGTDLTGPDAVLRSAYSSGAGATNSAVMWGTYVQTSLLVSHARASGGGIVAATAAYSASNFTIIAATWDANDAVTQWRDGVAAAIATGATATPTTHLRTRLGASSAATADFYLGGDMAEILVYSGVPTTAQLRYLMRGLSREHGLVLSA